MQPRYHTTSSSSDSSSSSGGDEAASLTGGPHNAASVDDCDSMLSSLASRVFLQVLSARVLGTQLDGSLGEIVEDDNCSDASDEDFGVDDANSLTAVSLAPSMSVSSIARAEQLLQKSVPLVNGGRHVSLTKEDVGRIRDSELLRFLETNSAFFVKYLHRHGDSATTEETTATAGDAGPGERVNIELEISNLANTIETFITAFDNDGHEYHICVDNEGKLLVPVAEEDDVVDDSATAAAEAVTADNISAEGDGGGDDVLLAGTVDSAKGAENDAEHETLTEATVEEKSGTGERCTPLNRGRLGRHVRLRSASVTPLKTLTSSSQQSQLQQQQRKSTKKKKKGKPSSSSGVKAGGVALVRRQPLLRVRGVGLTAEEDRRIAEVMHTDFAAEQSPYTVATNRLAAVEERLRWLREVRGPLDGGDTAPDVDDDAGSDYGRDDGGAIDDSTKSTDVAGDAATATLTEEKPTAKTLGDAYMREVREMRRRQARMQRINARLEQLHETVQLEALCPAEGVEKLACVPRPAWSRDLPPPPSEREIAALLESARRENAVAVERGEKPMISSDGDKEVAYLQEKLQLALGRAEALLSTPTAMPALSVSSSSLHAAHVK
ncbi:kinectin [Trypanosoma grayi]|uniref:kinectin n=1 Tax=Trypanosoma grayi TaxID=71804 RepID=UPI0004F49C4D|nr:kinectin [Trypanosoma grayi]KEG13936.1 kinectin [Trypanosoma grayi]